MDEKKTLNLEETVAAAHAKHSKSDDNSRKIPALVAFFLLLSISFGFLGGWLGAESRDNGGFSGNDQQVKEQVVDSESGLISDIAKNVGPSVVSVDVTGTSTDTNQSFLFGGGTDQTQQESAGTGIIINASGLILTNRHVVPTGTTSVSVTLSNGTQLNNVQVVGRTSDSDSLDVAFLQIKDAKGQTLKPATLGDSSKMQVGDKVVAIGNALGQFQNTVTDGILSGFGRSVQAGDQDGSSTENLQDLFQTDAAINEGNSGGPLVNTSGQVIGLNTAIAGDAQNIGFAIPINDLQGLIKSVMTQGKLLRPYLGVYYVPLTDDVAYQYKLSVKRGAYIAPSQNGQPAIIAGSPADKAGLQAQDIITKVDNTTIDQNNSLTSILGKYAVGAKITLTIIRGGKTISVNVTLGAAPTN